MKPLWHAPEIFDALGIEEQNDKALSATGVSIDTRTLVRGDLFIALKGPLADGHDHVRGAAARGAIGAVVSRFIKDLPETFQQYVVSDTFEALNALAAFSRKRTNAKVAAVTGSFGKTSCKEALGCLLSAQGATTTSQSSFNNHWGVPLSLSRLYQNDQFGVFEVGMNKPGEIEPLAKMLRPHVSLITTVEAMHMAHMGTVEAVAQEKASLFLGAEPGGVAVLNRDNPHFELLEGWARQKDLDVLTFGVHPESFARLMVSRLGEEGLHVEARLNKKAYTFRVPVFQNHWGMNAMGVLATLHALGANIDQGIESFKNFVLPEGRGAQQLIPLPMGGTFTLIDESYNAGPVSMKAALETLGHAKPGSQGRRIAVLAEMLELGDVSSKEHMNLLPLLEKAGVDVVFTLGEGIRVLHDALPSHKKAFHGTCNESLEDLAQAVIKEIRPGDVIMLKGSRGRRAYRGRLAHVVDALKALGIAPAERAS